MTEKPTGGPAFPSLNPTMTGIDSDGFERWDTEPCGGITVRDYFAIRALPVVRAHFIDHMSVVDMVHEAYQWADAMLEARQ